MKMPDLMEIVEVEVAGWLQPMLRVETDGPTRYFFLTEYRVGEGPAPFKIDPRETKIA